ncbi:hypothetical protein GCM10011611_48190 [Aliidongia dinghuensis]|uniref:SHOCT domain-containing protein n=1 Tax=Aliidongia dinghuensis TaxID=1867774 RepID=A0A8J2YYD7_9PROT|nr:SHOCT domain-containing protein [Aliidongia dinghuensis]GGF36134.1 hypothetical protein GCM10011611_48190 [Aliidongia dinghuensis]
MLLGGVEASCYDNALYRARYASPTMGQPGVAATPAVPAPGAAPAASGGTAPQVSASNASASTAPTATAPTSTAPAPTSQAVTVAASTTADPAAGSAALPPLNLPVHEDWSSAQCPDIAVTFSGHAQPLHSNLADTAMFQEARQFHDRDYYEVAECFCTKYGNLSQTTKSDADAVMTETAQQFATASRMRIRSAIFVEDSPLGKYSEFQAAAQPPSASAAALRTYWRGQCSMRVEAIWDPATSARALQFLDSLHETKAAAADKAATAATDADPGISVDDPAAIKAEPTDLASQLERRHKELTSGTAAAKAQVNDPPSSLERPHKELTSTAAATKGEANNLTSRPEHRHKELTTTTVIAPPSAATETSSSTTATGGALPADTASRLQHLKELQDKGLITKQEYETKRQTILNQL